MLLLCDNTGILALVWRYRYDAGSDIEILLLTNCDPPAFGAYRSTERVTVSILYGYVDSLAKFDALNCVNIADAVVCPAYGDSLSTNGIDPRFLGLLKLNRASKLVYADAIVFPLYIAGYFTCNVEIDDDIISDHILNSSMYPTNGDWDPLDPKYKDDPADQ